MITGKIGQAGQYIHTRVVRGLVATHLNPNILTFIGFSINVYAAYLFAEGRFLHAALTVILAGVFDLSDGPVARITNQATPFGAFFDSVMDRYSDVVLFIGILVYYARAGSVLYVFLAAVEMEKAVFALGEDPSAAAGVAVDAGCDRTGAVVERPEGRAGACSAAEDLERLGAAVVPHAELAARADGANLDLGHAGVGSHDVALGHVEARRRRGRPDPDVAGVVIGRAAVDQPV